MSHFSKPNSRSRFCIQIVIGLDRFDGEVKTFCGVGSQLVEVRLAVIMNEREQGVGRKGDSEPLVVSWFDSAHFAVSSLPGGAPLRVIRPFGRTSDRIMILILKNDKKRSADLIGYPGSICANKVTVNFEARTLEPDAARTEPAARCHWGVHRLRE
jgi:hypothetical protein